MTLIIIASAEDPASINIKKRLLEKSDWLKFTKFLDNTVYQHTKMKDVLILTINDRKITHENLDKEIEEKIKIKPKTVIFISRHTSKSGEPTLTVHPIGNYGKAQFGGITKTLVKSSPKLMTELLRNLKKNADIAKTYHKVCFEVTHHGPYLDTPTLFIEVGSTEEEWNKKKPAEIVAKTILDVLNLYHYEEDFEGDIPVIMGIGGGHYAPRFTDIILEKKCAFGHMIPGYHINDGNINDEILEKTINATPNLKAVYIHRKSLRKPQIREFRNWFEKRKIPVISSKELSDI